MVAVFAPRRWAVAFLPDATVDGMHRTPESQLIERFVEQLARCFARGRLVDDAATQSARELAPSGRR